MIKAIATEEIIRNQIVELSLKQHHKKYVHNTYGEETFDCAGFVWYIFNKLYNINIFSLGYGLSTTTKRKTSKYGFLKLLTNNFNGKTKLIKSGDILFFHRQSLKDSSCQYDNKYPGHFGIYLGDDKFIHALISKCKVVISNFCKSKYWYDILVAYKDIVSTDLINRKILK